MLCHSVFNSVSAVMLVLAYFGTIPDNFGSTSQDLGWLIPLAVVATLLLFLVLRYIGQLSGAHKDEKVYVAPVDNSLSRGRFSFAEMALLTIIVVIFAVVALVGEVGTRVLCSNPQNYENIIHNIVQICNGG